MLKKVVRRFRHTYNDLKYLLTTCIQKMIFVCNNIKFGKNLKVCGRIFLQNSGNIIIGNNVRINSSFSANPVSAARKTTFMILGGTLEIGDGSGISNSFFGSKKKIVIGKDVMIGVGCQIFDTDFHPLQSKFRVGELRNDSYIGCKEVIIEDKVFIGAGSIILKGSYIGEGAVIGAGSVVSGYIPKYEIWAGNPAKFIKKGE